MKVLLITHNPMSEATNMGKTFISLFSSFEKNELCQLYVYPSLPDKDYCGSYYRITDRDAMKSIFPFVSGGKEIKNNSRMEQEKLPKIYNSTGNGSPAKRILRDFMWKISGWYSKDLRKWIEKENPGCIFLAPGYAKFIYDIALKISKDYSLPIISYICDDYYFVEQPESFIGKIQLSLLRKKMTETLGKSKHIIAICENIKNDYQEEFGTESTVIMTGASFKPCVPAVKPERKAISYFGNIRCGRYVSLLEIGKALDKINSENETEYILKIYTGEKNREILESFEGIKSIKLMGFVAGKEFEEAFFSSDVLLHTEAFDKTSIDLVKNSVSTKIADSLASGIPVLAYGPENIASMQHLIKNESAVICTAKGGIENAMKKIFRSDNECRKIVNNALETAKKFHDSEKNGILLKETAERICSEG